MKSIFTFLLFTTAIFFISSCGGDDEKDCDPGTFESNLIGTWNTPSLNPSVPAGEVTFNADFTGVTTADSAFDRGDVEFDWRFDSSDSTLFIGSFIYEMKEFDCDEVDLFSVAFDFTITRQ